MAGHRPPQPPYLLPERPGGQVRTYAHVPRRRPPRRSAGGTIAGLVGGLAAVLVLGALGFAGYGALTRASSAGVAAGAPVPRRVATGNTLYASGRLVPVRCALPRLTDEGPSMRRFMETLSDCLDASWTGQFRRSGMKYAVPRRVFWDQPGRSPCGSYPSPGSSAFYCPANNTMYVGLRHIVETSGGEPLEHYAVFARVIAHEYGHHVQDSAGILAYGQQEMEKGDDLARTEASRRIELQAQCLAGAWLGAERGTLPMTRLQYEAMVNDVRHRGDDGQPADRRDHGSGRHYAGWLVRGYRGDGPAVCNTWTAPADEVS
ncbi:neutral zinc metallopeptidase [Actinomadura rayongensis]|uniref:neutral zinc metallopeptidase n=1 Tax=Actinomadura rayongensis TaxID=1429076 RepID=UPI001925BE02|nr:neutral zinc metallopeptidase [Actinomadura rayongensis]